MRFNQYELVDEPDGGAVTPDVVDAAASEPEPEPASEPEAEETSEQPVSEVEDAPAEAEGTEPPADELTDEDWQAIYEKYPDRDPNKVREAALKEAQKPPPPERAKANDPFFNAVTNQANESYQRIAQSIGKMAAGELDSADDLMADIATTGAYQAASERRGHIAVNKAVMERALGVENGQLDESNDLHGKYGDLLTALESAQQNAYRLRGQAVREYDPQKRADIITRAEIMDANAVGNFYHESLNLAIEKGKADGKADAEKAFGRRAPKLVEQARSNGHTEAIAKARNTVLAGKAQTSANVQGKAPTSGPLTVEEAQTLPISELIARSRAQEGK